MKQVRLKYFSEDFDTSLINLTPLIDVLFVILVTFILVAPLVNSDQVELAPATFLSEKKTPKTSRIAIYVRKDNSVWVDGKKTQNSKELSEVLSKKRQWASKETPQVFQDKNGSFGTYQMVKDCLERAGFKEMEVVLQAH